jgi:hypothetical protein
VFLFAGWQKIESLVTEDMYDALPSGWPVPVLHTRAPSVAALAQKPQQQQQQQQQPEEDLEFQQPRSKAKQANHSHSAHTGEKHPHPSSHPGSHPNKDAKHSAENGSKERGRTDADGLNNRQKKQPMGNHNGHAAGGGAGGHKDSSTSHVKAHDDGEWHTAGGVEKKIKRPRSGSARGRK